MTVQGRDGMEAMDVTDAGSHWVARFRAMAGTCEVLVDTGDEMLARHLASLALSETRRIEAKFSRYRDDNVVAAINGTNGDSIVVDDETANLLDYADTCFRLSEGRFDITSGVLRRVWQFDGSDRLPDPGAVSALLPRIGWQRVRWERPRLTVPAGMELDFGGIGKEYAVDRVLGLLGEVSRTAVLVNFGGDLAASGPRRDGQGWTVGIEDPLRAGDPSASPHQFELQRGAVATSGDSRRFLLRDGIRYGHILDPRTGWPVPNAPRSVTVIAATCLNAGMLATFAMLHGKEAESFLSAQGVRYWCLR